MTTTINIRKVHSVGLEEAKVRAHELVERFRQKLSHLISDVAWSPDGTRGTASGKLFNAVFQITDTDIIVDVELKGLGARVMKGQIQAQIEKNLEKQFG